MCGEKQKEANSLAQAKLDTLPAAHFSKTSPWTKDHFLCGFRRPFLYLRQSTLVVNPCCLTAF